MISKNLKRVLVILGAAFGLAGVWFVANRLIQYSQEIELSHITIVRFIALAIVALVYGVSGMLLAIAWRSLLARFSIRRTILWSIGIYGTSQLAKYVPGNVIHLAGRHVLAAANGISNMPLAKSALWELMLIATTAVPFALLTLPIRVSMINEPVGIILFIVVISAWISLAFLLFGGDVGRAMTMQCLFLCVSGLTFVVVLLLSSPQSTTFYHDLPVVCGAFVVSWLIGLVTPGAPAGAGVREFVLYTLLQSLIHKSDLLLAVLLGRMVTVAGDLLFYLYAWVVQFYLRRNQM